MRARIKRRDFWRGGGDLIWLALRGFGFDVRNPESQTNHNHGESGENGFRTPWPVTKPVGGNITGTFGKSVHVRFPITVVESSWFVKLNYCYARSAEHCSAGLVLA